MGRYIDELLEFLAGIDWENERVPDNWEVEASHPFSKVFDAITVIMDELNQLLEERRLAQQALEENERKLDALIENTPDLACSMDRHLKLTTFNSAFQAFMQRTFNKTVDEEDAFIDLLPPDLRANLASRLTKALAGSPSSFEEDFGYTGTICYEFSVSPIVAEEGPMGLTLFGRDILARKRTELELRDAQRQAGMSEVATGVLHNVGNAVNSINVSLHIIQERLSKSEAPKIRQVAQLLEDHTENLSEYIAHDDKGKLVLPYLAAVSDELADQGESLRRELRHLREHVEHVTEIVRAQQAHAGSPAVLESLSLGDVVEAAFQMVAPAFQDAGIRIKRDYQEIPPFIMDRHLAIQVLVNLLTNARRALREVSRADKLVLIEIKRLQADRVCVKVADNGIGIATDVLPRIFELGFSTRREGHGFGLHASANAARQMGGALTGESPGLNQGATFRLELPLEA